MGQALAAQKPTTGIIHAIELPLYYQNPAAEIQAVREGAGLFDASYYEVLKVAGKDATDFLHSLTTNDVVNLPIGHLQHSSLLDRKGKVQALFSIIHSHEEAYLLLIQPDLMAAVQALLAKMVFIREVEITDESDTWGLIWVVGPQAEHMTGEALGVHGDMLALQNKIVIPPDMSAWHLWRSDRWAVPHMELLLPRGQVGQAFDLIAEAGATIVGKSAIDLVRVEKGVPEFGLEIDATRILLEAHLDDCFARNMGCYPGQEVVERISAYGEGKTPNKLAILTINGNHTLEESFPVLSPDGSAAGTVVRSLYDPSRDVTLLIAYIARPFLEQLEQATLISGGVQL